MRQLCHLIIKVIMQLQAGVIKFYSFSKAKFSGSFICLFVCLFKAVSPTLNQKVFFPRTIFLFEPNVTSLLAINCHYYRNQFSHSWSNFASLQILKGDNDQQSVIFASLGLRYQFSKKPQNRGRKWDSGSQLLKFLLNFFCFPQLSFFYF